MGDVLRWRGRQFWCEQCKGWVDVPPGGSITGQRKEHLREHDAEVQMFSRLDLMELDAMLDGYYGEGS